MGLKVGSRSPHLNEAHGSRLGGGRWIRLASVAAALFAATAAAAESEPAAEAPELRCGATVRGQLAAGEVASFTLVAQPGQRIALDTVDTSGGGELLRLRVHGEGIATNTCTGRVQPPLRAATLLVAGKTYTVEVSDCKGSANVEYALSLNTVSAISQNCGTLLPCGERIDAQLEEPGQVDSYRFDGTVGDTVMLESAESSATLDGIELRIFDPDGLPVQAGSSSGDCATSRSVVLPKSGVYTVLANACFGGGIGGYQLGWYPTSCPPVTLLGRHNADDRLYIRTSRDGSSIVEIGAGRLSCGFLETSGFLLQPDPALPISGGHFSGSDLQLPARALTLEVDGALTDSDGNGTLDQAIGGLSVLKQGGRCNFEWVATSLADADGDGWADVAENRMSSDRYGSSSTPEARDVRTTDLLGPDACHDWLDNDGDGHTDANDPACQPVIPPVTAAPKLFAGRLQSGDSLWFQLSADGGTLQRIGSNSLGCGALSAQPRDLDLAVPLSDRRFVVDDLSLSGDARWSFDGVVFDGDGDTIPDQALGGLTVRVGPSECHFKWWATGHVDSDSDGWSDDAERHLGSDPVPLPAGKGAASVPENGAVPTTAEAGTGVCADGVDNDEDGATDSEDSPDCLPAEATPTPTMTPEPTRTPGGACVGDCDGSGAVTVDEVILGVNIVLGERTVAECSGLDGNSDRVITVDELITAVNHILLGCP